MSPEQVIPKMRASAYQAPKSRPKRYRASSRASRRTSSRGSPSVSTPGRGQNKIYRRLEVPLQSASPPKRLFKATREQPGASRPAGHRTRSFAKGMLSSKSCTDENTVMTGHFDEEGSSGPTLVEKCATKLPPFQQSKHWPGSSYSQRQKSLLKDSEYQAHDVSAPATHPASGDAKPSPSTPQREHQQLSSKANDSTSITDANPLCGLPTIAALADLKNRQSIKTQIAVRRWLSKSSTIGHIEPVSSQDKQHSGRGEKRSSFPRRMQSIGHKLGSKKKAPDPVSIATSKDVGKQGTATRAGSRDRVHVQKSSNRLSQSLIPNGDTCDFEQEMNREYPKIKQKHFGDIRGVHVVSDNVVSTSAFITQVKVDSSKQTPRKSIDKLRPAQNTSESIPTIEIFESTPQNRPATSNTASNSRAKMSMMPPPRTSSRTAIDATPTTVHTTSDGSPRSRGTGNVLSSQNLKRRSGGFLRARKPSNGSMSGAPDLRTAASKDTLAEIEAQAGGYQKKSFFSPSTAVHSPGSVARNANASGNPPERPLPELPPGMSSNGGEHSQHKTTKATERLAQPKTGNSRANRGKMMSPVSERERAAAQSIQTTTRVHNIAASKELSIELNHTPVECDLHRADLRSPSSIYSQESLLSAYSPIKALKSKSDPGRAERVSQRTRQDLAARPPHQHSCISEEDEDESLDLADKFPPVPSSRATSRSRSRGHGRHPSVTSSVHARDRRNSAARKARPGFSQHLARSQIMIVADTNPLTATFSASTRSRSPSVASLKTFSPQHKVQKKTSRRSIRSTQSNQSAKIGLPAFPSSLGSIAHTPPSSASSDADSSTEEADELSVVLEEARAVPVPDRIRTSRATPRQTYHVAAPVTSRNQPSTINSENLSLVHQASKVIDNVCTQDFLEHITSELDAVKKAINVDLHTLTAERDMVLSENAKLMALLVKSHQSQYRQSTLGTRELEPAFVERPQPGTSVVRSSPSSASAGGVWKVEGNRVSWSSSGGKRVSMTDRGRPLSGTSGISHTSSSTASILRRTISHASQETTTSYPSTKKSPSLDQIVERDSLDVGSGWQAAHVTTSSNLSTDTKSTNVGSLHSPLPALPTLLYGRENQTSRPIVRRSKAPPTASLVYGSNQDADEDDRRVSHTLRDTNQMDAMLMNLLPVTYIPMHQTT